MLSCIYEGDVRHRRTSPVKHEFRYGLFMLYLHLEELPQLLKGGYGLHETVFSPASFCRKDHLGDPSVPLQEAVLGLVKKQTGLHLSGPVGLLTLLRHYGYYFSPLSLYFCWDPAGESVTAIVAEVTNTPWLQKHWYVLWEGNQLGGSPALQFRHRKTFHVSPFMDMGGEYEWRLTPPGSRMTVLLANRRNEQPFFEVSMALQRLEMSRGMMVRMGLRHPWISARVSQAIYWQALWLWWKKCPFYPHPAVPSTTESRRV